MDKKPTMKHPNNLQYLMDRDGLKPIDIAKAWGVDNADVAKRIHGYIGITPRRAKKLQQVFNWTFDELYGEAGLKKADIKSKEPNKINEFETALAYSMKAIILLLVRQKTLNADEVSLALADGVQLFQKRLELDAAGLLEDLRQFAIICASPVQQQELHTLLSTTNLGKA